MPPTTAKRDASDNLLPTVKAQTIPNEEEIVVDDGWEEDKFKKLKEPLDFDCFKPASYHRIENKKEDILLVLEGPLYVPPLTLSPFLDLVYFSPISHYCGLMNIAEDVARYAVSRYNERQERSFTFLGVTNANYLWSSISHFFFITLEATDTSTSDKTRRTFQTGVYYPLNRIDLRDVWCFKPVLMSTNEGGVAEEEEDDEPFFGDPQELTVKSMSTNEDVVAKEEEDDEPFFGDPQELTVKSGDFRMSTNENVVAEEEEDDDGWETESFKCMEGDEPFFGDPLELTDKSRQESGLVPYHPHCLKSPYMQMLAKFAVDLYNEKKKKKDREIQFVQISSGNYAGHSGRSLYYLILKARDSSTGMERTFCANVQEYHNVGSVGRVRFFKPSKQKVLTRHNEESIVSGDDGWEDEFLKEWQTRRISIILLTSHTIQSKALGSLISFPVKTRVSIFLLFLITVASLMRSRRLLTMLLLITTEERYPSKDDSDVWDLWSFKPKESNDVDDSMIGDEDDDDGWETESFKHIEKSLPYDVFGDPGDYDSGKPDLEDPFSMESVAQCAVRMYKKRKGINLKFVKISKANRAFHLRCFLYYLTIEVIDTSTGVEKTFLTNVLVPEDGVLPLRVRVFKPKPGC